MYPALTDFIEVSNNEPLSVVIRATMRAALLKFARLKGVSEVMNKLYLHSEYSTVTSECPCSLHSQPVNSIHCLQLMVIKKMRIPLYHLHGLMP